MWTKVVQKRLERKVGRTKGLELSYSVTFRPTANAWPGGESFHTDRRRQILLCLGASSVNELRNDDREMRNTEVYIMLGNAALLGNVDSSLDSTLNQSPFTATSS